MTNEANIQDEGFLTTESTLFFQITPWELQNLKEDHNHRLRKVLESIGHDVSSFRGLFAPLGTRNIEGKIDYDPDIQIFPVYNKSGNKIEDVASRKLSYAETPDRFVELADIKLYPEVLNDNPEIGFHKRAGEWGGFEAMYVTGGEAVLSLPHQVVPLSDGEFSASSEVLEVRMVRDTLAIIPSTVANYWTSVAPEGLEFRYVCEPPWSEDGIQALTTQ